MRFAKRLGPRAALAGLALDSSGEFEALASYLRFPNAGDQPATRQAGGLPRVGAGIAGPTSLRLDRVLRELHNEAGRLRREAVVFKTESLPAAGEAAARIADSLRSVAAALQAPGAEAADLSLRARRDAATAEKRAGEALNGTLSSEGPAGLKARSVIKGLSEAADLAERAADLAGELALEES